MWERRSSAAHTPAAGIHTIRRIRARRSLVAASADVSTTPARQPTSSRSNDPSGPKYILCCGTPRSAIAVLAGHRLEMALRGVPQQRMYFGPDGSFDLLLVGCLAGVVLTSADAATRERLARILRIVWIPAAGVCAALLLRSHIWDRSVYEGLLLVFGIAVACLLLTVVLDERSLPARVLGFGPLVYLGKISYGVYLWHQIVLAGGLIPFSIGFYVRGGIGIALSLAIASVSYRFVERPFLQRKRRDRIEVEQAPVPAAAAAATL